MIADLIILRPSTPEYEQARQKAGSYCALCGKYIDQGFTIIVAAGCNFHKSCAEKQGIIRPQKDQILERFNYRF